MAVTVEILPTLCGARHKTRDVTCYRPHGHPGDHAGHNHYGDLNVGTTRWCPCDAQPGCPICGGPS